MRTLEIVAYWAREESLATVGLDSLVVLLLIVARLSWLAELLGWDVAPALVLLGFAYVWADLWGRADSAREPASYRLKLALLIGVSLIYAVFPTVRLILERHANQPWSHVHDNVIQMEEAAKLLVAGKNPYAADYLSTPLYQWDRQNPALYHVVNLPLQILLAVPFQQLALHTLGWFDLRVVYLALFAVVLALLPRLAPSRQWSLLLVAAFVLNPLFTRNFVEGRNDIVVIAALVGALELLRRRRGQAAAALVGAGCAAKHTMWLALPLFVALLAPSATWAGLRRGAWRARWALLVPLALFLPFLAWGPRALFASILGYPSGLVAHSYPIRGAGSTGFSIWVLSWKLVAGDDAYFPFWLPQLLFGLPALVFALRLVRRQRDTQALLTGFALTLFPVQFFSRYFNGNHLGFILFVLALAVLAQPIRCDDH